MKVVIMGSGRVGARLAGLLDADGHEVTILDLERDAFRRIPEGFRGRALVGNGTDIDTLRRIGLDDADAFAAVTQGDNRNVMAAQMAKHLFNVPKVVCRLYDPIRREIYEEMGLVTISTTTVGADLVRAAINTEG